MSNLPFEDDPFNDDPFRDIPPIDNASGSGSSGSNLPRGDINAGPRNVRNPNDFGPIGRATIDDTTEDLPADLLIPAPRGRRNVIFIAGLGLLALVVVIGLGVILFSALQNRQTNIVYQQTADAVQLTNNAVFTAVAATSTAKSWTATPSKTPTPTLTLTPTLTNTPVPSKTLTPTLTVTPSLTFTRAPDVTPPTNTPIPPSPLPTLALDNSALAAQIARLQAAVQILLAQQTQIAQGPKVPAALTESAQINSALTAISGQLTANPGAPSIRQPIGTSTPTPTNTITPTLPELFPPTATVTPVSANFNSGMAVMNIRQPAQIVGTPVSPQPPKSTLSKTLVGATATAQYLSTNDAQLNLVQTAIGIQLTMNAMTPTSVAGNEEANQLELGLTAVSYQLTEDQSIFKRLTLLTAYTPRTGLYDDLANGRATPGSLALIGLAAIGLVGVIIASRRMRAK